MPIASFLPAMSNEDFEKELRALVLTACETPSFNPSSSPDCNQALLKNFNEK